MKNVKIGQNVHGTEARILPKKILLLVVIKLYLGPILNASMSLLFLKTMPKQF